MPTIKDLKDNIIEINEGLVSSFTQSSNIVSQQLVALNSKCAQYKAMYEALLESYQKQAKEIEDLKLEISTIKTDNKSSKK